MNLLPLCRHCYPRWDLGSLCWRCGQWGRGLLCGDCFVKLTLSERRCRTCALSLPWVAGHYLTQCTSCQLHPPLLKTCWAAGDYVHETHEGLKPLIVAWKFQEQVGLTRLMVQLLHQTLLDSEDAAWPFPTGATVWCVPVPQTADKLAHRGFAPTVALAQGMVQHLRHLAPQGLPSSLQWQWTTCLIKSFDTPDQHGLSQKDRLNNLNGVFTIHPNHLHWIKNQSFVLIDDILTTGSTLQACAKTLYEAGAAVVCAWVIARTPMYIKKPILKIDHA